MSDPSTHKLNPGQVWRAGDQVRTIMQIEVVRRKYGRRMHSRTVIHFHDAAGELHHVRAFNFLKWQLKNEAQLSSQGALFK